MSTIAPTKPDSKQVPSTGKQALLVAQLDLRRRLLDRSVILQVFLAPILLAVIVGAAFSGTGGSLDADIWVVDADGSADSQRVISALEDSNTDEGGVQFVAKDRTEVSDPQDAVLAGQTDAIIVIPAGFGAATPRETPITLQVYGDAGDEIVGGVAQAAADSIAASVRTSQISAATANAAAQALGQPLDQDRLGEALQQPAVIDLSNDVFENSFNVMSFFAPGMAMIFLFFVMGAAARSIITERRQGTLNRILAGPSSSSGVLLGKSISVFAIGTISMITVWLVTTFVFSVDWGDWFGVLLVILSAVCAIAGISLIIVGLARTEQQAESITIVGTLIFAVLGGTFVYSASGALASARNFTPNGQALQAFVDLAAGGASWVEVLPRVGLLVGIGVVTGAIGLAAVRKGMAR